MKLELESGDVVHDVSEQELDRIEGAEFAILSQDEMTYIQCAEQTWVPDAYVLEFQNGSLDEHFRVVDEAITLDQVLSAFRKYLRGDDSWRNDFRWEHVKL